MSKMIIIDEYNKKKILDLMQVIELEYLNLKIYLLKDILLIDKVNNTVP